MDITAPFGYREVVPFLRDQRILLSNKREFPDLATQRNVMPISVSELQVASHDYPIVFAPNADGSGYVMIAVLGLVDGENLFMQPGGWVDGSYVPAYLRRHPFCMTRVAVDSVAQTQRIVCVEKDSISPEGMELFDAEGKPSKEWLSIEGFLNEFEADMHVTEGICALLADFKLLEPFTMQATIRDQSFNFGGMARVDEKRLEQLTSNELKALIKKGAMRVIYTHLASLTRFNFLLDRKSLRMSAAAPVKAD